MNIIVTGASKGIGYELVKEFAGDSSNRIIAIARDYVSLKKLQKECISKKPSSSVIIFESDLSDHKAISVLCKKIIEHFSDIDILINNAGALVNKRFCDTSFQDIEHIYRVNVFSVYLLVQGLYVNFNRKQRSHIVNIASMGGVQGSVKFPGLSAYSSSKAALAGLTECMAEEFKEENIAVNCLALGAVHTEMLAKAFPDYKAKTTASDMAKYIASFALTGQAYFNGKIIPVSSSTP